MVRYSSCTRTWCVLYHIQNNLIDVRSLYSFFTISNGYLEIIHYWELLRISLLCGSPTAAWYAKCISAISMFPTTIVASRREGPRSYSQNHLERFSTPAILCDSETSRVTKSLLKVCKSDAESPCI
ncbi:hypothetical protein NPIL_388101 [Nephila pilipes]|uniref:Uncharacterized protein n=1 Tax=Nephila pilipes TaxID=299642 RepID=A0A8X6TY35_NEPPI|nr:hypothetical protein NPIL_388101 [Nephila pilipes]